MYKIIKEHYLAFVLALFIGVITLVPQLLAIKNLGDRWQGVYPIVNDDEVYYLARGQEIVDGYYFLSNPYLYEHKDGSPMQFWLPDFLLAYPLKILNVPVVLGYKFYDFIWPVLLALLSYVIIFNLSGSKKLSLLGTAFLHVGMFLNLFNRSPSPQFIFIFWLALALFIILYEKTAHKKYLILSTLTFGLLFYMYPYYWTYYVILFFVYIILRFLFERKFAWKNYFFLLLGGGLISIPYFISLWQSSKFPFYKESVVRLGLLYTHFPSGIRIVFFGLLILGFFIWSAYKKRLTLNNISLLILSGVLACIIAVNQHIITGKNLEFSSHYFHLSVAWYVFSFAYLISVWLPLRKNAVWLARSVSLFLIGWIVFSMVSTVNAQIKPNQQEIEWQKYGPILDWLRENTVKDSVVFANQELSSLIPAYTSDNVFYAREANLFFISNNEIEERFILNHYWDDFTDDFIKKNERSIWGTQFINNYIHNQSKNKVRKIFGLKLSQYERLPQVEIERIKKIAVELKNDDFFKLIKKFKIDYLIWDKKNRELNSKYLKEVAEINGMVIYKFD